MGKSARNDFDVVGNLVGGEHRSVAVPHQTSRRINFFNSLCIVGRIKGVAGVNELNIDESQHKEHQDGKHPEG